MPLFESELNRKPNNPEAFATFSDQQGTLNAREGIAFPENGNHQLHHISIQNALLARKPYTNTLLNMGATIDWDTEKTRIVLPDGSYQQKYRSNPVFGKTVTESYMAKGLKIEIDEHDPNSNGKTKKVSLIGPAGSIDLTDAYIDLSPNNSGLKFSMQSPGKAPHTIELQVQTQKNKKVLIVNDINI
ncbi:MAG TPA: hypothetical protein VNW29_06290 [Candidatus Sulfotelmatobacter sp.]|jgi:hypothetical protein|nr:hypothetical protein [Candidatus Sulfotelmatobacter sp.]